MAGLLNDRYELGEVVGSGGMGAVYRATDTRLGRIVAVKVLRGGPLADDTARGRMRSEANLAAAIQHPGVAQVFDFDDGTGSPASMPFIVMQFVEGHTLAQLLREQGPMPPDQVMSVVVQVAAGLQAAHDVGVVHRDLKPANIMLTPDGRAVLVDFGIARSATSEPLTDTGALLGTADYMSPEQASGRPATPQSDLYALGVVAYHCLTGESPFRRESPVATALAHLQDDLPVSDARVPPEVADLIASLAAKNPADRPPSAAAIALQAAALGAASSIDLPPTFELPALGDQRRPAGATTGRAGIAAMAGSRHRRPMATYAGMGLLAAILGFVGFQQMRSGESPVVPDVVGMSAADASARIKDVGMTARPQVVDVAGTPEGQVVKQSPEGGTVEPGDGAVAISVASGRVAVAADELIGTTYAEASAALETLGFEVKREDVTQASGAGEVVALDKSGRVLDGSTITLSVAVAPTAAPAQSTAPLPSSSGSGNTKSTGSTENGKAKGKAKGKK